MFLQLAKLWILSTACSDTATTHGKEVVLVVEVPEVKEG